MYSRSVALVFAFLLAVQSVPVAMAATGGPDAAGAAAVPAPDPPRGQRGCVQGCGGCTAKCAARKPPSLDEVTFNLRRSYSDVSGLSMFFEQVNSWVDVPEAGEKSKGTLWAAQGNRIRMEYSEPPGHLLVADGSRVWVYVPENKQAVVDTTGMGEGAALAEMIMDFLSEGHVTMLDSEERKGATCHVLLVEDISKPEGLESVKIWVDPRTWLARGLELRDVNDNLTSFTFWDVKRLEKVGADLFTFEAPPGVEVVESPVGAGGS